MANVIDGRCLEDHEGLVLQTGQNFEQGAEEGEDAVAADLERELVGLSEGNRAKRKRKHAARMSVRPRVWQDVKTVLLKLFLATRGLFQNFSEVGFACDASDVGKKDRMLGCFTTTDGTLAWATPVVTLGGLTTFVLVDCLGGFNNFLGLINPQFQKLLKSFFVIHYVFLRFNNFFVCLIRPSPLTRYPGDWRPHHACDPRAPGR